MTSLAEIIRAGQGRAGFGGSWHCETRPSGERVLTHCDHEMLRWLPGPPPEATFVSTGWGTVSEQIGCNVAFRELGLAFYFARDRAGGGARIEPTRKSEPGSYPRRTETGTVVWACCESSIGPECRHRAPVQRPQPRPVARRPAPAADSWPDAMRVQADAIEAEIAAWAEFVTELKRAG
jgi:hypothetical protein